MTLRSGTNQLRGSGILLHRGTWLDSNQIQNIRNNISNEEHKYYNGEAMVSGPIAATRRSSWAATRASTRTSRSRSRARCRPRRSCAATSRRRRRRTARRSSSTTRRRRRATRTSARARGSRSRATSFRRTAGSPIAKALLPHIPRPNATPSNLVGIEQLHQLAEHRPLPLQLVPRRASITSSARTTGCRSATAATGASSTATRTRCRSRRSAATTTRRTAITT